MADKGARQNSRFLAFCTAPDFCKTPVGSSTPPLPYQVMADLGKSDNTVTNVRFTGNPCYVFDQSIVPHCIGDEPGILGGVISGTVRGEVKPAGASTTVRAGGKRVVREFDPCTLNSGNCPGIYVTMPTPRSVIGTGGKPTTSANPHVEPTPAEKEGFLKKLWKQTKSDLGAAKDNPGEAAMGAVKGQANSVLDLTEPMARGSMLNHAADMEERAAILRLSGMSRSADQMQSGAEALRQAAGNSTSPRFDMSHPSAQAGDSLFSMGQLLLGVAGLLKSGVKMGLRSLGRALSREADDAAKLAVKGAAGAADTASDAVRAEKAIAGKGRQIPQKGGAPAPDVNKRPKGDGVRIKRTAHEGAAFGEQKAHAKMKEMGYERIDKGGEYKPGRNGIDGVYRNPSPPPDYVVLEAKYNTSALDSTLDGRQMSDSWIRGDATGFNRLREAVGPKAAANIRTSLDAGTAQRWLMHVDESGNVTIKVLDAFGKVIKP